MVDVGDFYKLNKSNGFRNLSPAIATAYHWVGCRTCTYPARGTRRQQPGTGTPCLCCMRPNAEPPPAVVYCGAAAVIPRRERILPELMLPAPAPGSSGGWCRRSTSPSITALSSSASYKDDGVCCTYVLNLCSRSACALRAYSVWRGDAMSYRHAAYRGPAGGVGGRKCWTDSGVPLLRLPVWNKYRHDPM
jgi:hypothetical protein